MSNIVIPDGGNIGSASDPDAISIASSGKPTFSQGIANTGTIDAGAIGSAVTMSANQACVKTAVNATGSAPIYVARAWVQFDGTSGSGTGSSDITRNASRNVSSVTDNGTGDYTINITTALEDANYAVVGSGIGSGGTYNCFMVSGSVQTMTTSAVRIALLHTSGTTKDLNKVTVIIFK